MPTIERQLGLTKEVTSWYRSKALYFDCLSKRRFRPMLECCKGCKLDTENAEYCDFVYMEIDAMSGREEDEPVESFHLGNTKFGKPKPRNSKKIKRDKE